MKTWWARLTVLILLFCLCSCASPIEETAAVEEDAVEVVSEEPEITPDEFYEKMAASSVRPIAVMIDNDADYYGPQSGLENAYLIYEIYVEGGSTRMMALFDGGMMTDEEKETRIGPVRSSRHYFLDFALENDAVYAHCGFSPRAQSEISSRGVNNINGLYESTPFFRYSEYNNGWHNLYTSYDRLYAAAENSHGYRMTGDEKLNYRETMEIPGTGDAATGISIPYRQYTMSYRYDEEAGRYLREKRGSAHTMQSGVQLSATNILILKMTNVPLNDGENKDRQDLYDTGSGEGIYITGGKAQAITWEKSDRSARTHYRLNGEELFLNPGVTIVQIVPPTMAISIE